MVLEDLQKLLEEHKEKRVMVVGTTGTGKSWLVERIPGTVDMDKVVFGKLTKKERGYVCQTPWTEEIGREMIRLTRQHVSVAPGHPVFGTVVCECDLIVYLRISDDLLRERVTLRDNNFADAKNMQRQIEQEIRSSGIPTIEFIVG